MFNVDMVTNNILNMIIFDKIKIGNPIIDMIVTSICLSLITILIKKINNYYSNLKINYDIFDLFYKKNVIKYQGLISITNSSYNQHAVYTSSFSDSFKSLWYFIIKNIEKNKNINEITEYIIEHEKTHEYGIINNSCYMVTQKTQFTICEKLNIYAQVMIDTSSTNDDKSLLKHQHEKISIFVYSYKSDIKTIKEYIENLTISYLSLLENCRKNKLYIYTLLKGVSEKNKWDIWDEIHFSSTRSFSNIFFKEKNDIIKKIDFFLNNKQWYYDKGIPYSLGIGTYGPPGTGKTSLIKSIANYTNRHIIVISLKMIKTKIQLNNIFFEEFYNSINKTNIGFDKKIIVFEDIDCIGNIVLNRNDRNDNNNKDIDNVITNKIFEKINEKMCENNEESPITLDDLLNLWDGIRETSGRILIITSNHYDKLDPALVRPGRIDITLELSYVSHTIIKEMYKHFFEEEIEENILQNIKEDFYTPAEITNLYMNSNNNKDVFIDKILQNKHI
jgi:hypothetical protein